MNCPYDIIRPSFRGQLLQDEPMCLHTSLKTGGPADLYAIPESAEDLNILLSWLAEEDIPWMPIGRGYNLLVRDKGFRGAIISLERFNRITAIGGSQIKAEAGAENMSVVRFAQKMGLGGIGFISGIPGTIGGAIKMNAGAYGEGILERTDHLALLRNGLIHDFRIEELDYGYRHLRLEESDIVLSAVFNLYEREPTHTEEEIRKDLELRRSKHNVGYPSAGSFFKNPHDQAAWRLIDVAGMRGVKVGGAQVSEVHSNFLVNTGGASTQDFLDLAEQVKNAVNATSGVTLEEEVRIVGEI
jgi:UDP-N-acetylmuramate dehydrogenase